jgi:hypothetical protein
MNQNANAFNLNLNDNFNSESKSQIMNNNMQKFNNMMNNEKYNNNNHNFDYNNNNNNNFNNNNFNNNFNNKNFNNNNFSKNNSFNNNFNFNNNNMMNMFNFLNTTWQMFQMYNNNQKNENHSTMRLIKKNSSDFDSQVLRNFSKTVIDISPNYQGAKINIFFQNSSGTKVNVLSPSDITVKDLLLNYVLKIGLGENVIDSAIYFLFSGAKLKKNDKRKIYELGILNGTIIIVIDRNSVMGA